MTPRQPVLEIIDEQIVDILRKMTPAERLNMATGMWESARVMLSGAIRSEHPVRSTYCNDAQIRWQLGFPRV